MDTSKLLLSWDSYIQKDFSQIPYLFSIQKENQRFQYFGAKHIYTYPHPQFEQLKNSWTNFLLKTNSENIVVMVEGSLRKVAADEQTAVTQEGGEGGLITYLASKIKCEIISPEPNKLEVIQQILNSFSKEEVLYSQIASLIIQWHKTDKQEPIEEYLQYFLQRYEKRFNWTNFDFTLDHIKEIHTHLFDTRLNYNDKDFFFSIHSPSEKNGRLNDLTRQENIIRDTAIVENIMEQWNKGKNIFVVYSFSHAMIQEPALKKLLV